MNHELAVAIIEEYGEKKQGQRGAQLSCPCCGKEISSTYSWSSYRPTRICENCTTIEIPPEDWAIVHNPEQWGMVQKFYCSIGRFNPIRKGYVVIEAACITEARSIFHEAYPGIGAIFADRYSDEDKARKHCYGTIHYRSDSIPPITDKQNV